MARDERAAECGSPWETPWLRLLVRPVYAEGTQREASALAARTGDWRRVLERIRAEGLLPRMAVLLRTWECTDVPAGVLEDLHEYRVSQATHTMLLVQELGTVLEAFGQVGIDTIAFKGPVLAQSLYGDVCGRAYGDLDLLVHRSRRHRAGAVLQGLGYEPLEPVAPGPGSTLRHSAAVSFACPGRADVDLHWGLSTPLMPFHLTRTGIGSRTREVSVSGLTCLTLGREDTFLHLCFHAAKDDWIRWSSLADLAAHMAVERDLDLDRVRHLAELTGTRRILRVALLLAASVAQAPMPTALRRWVARDPRALAVLEVARRTLTEGRAASQTIRDRLGRMLRLRERPRDRLLSLLGAAARASEPRPGELWSPWTRPLRRPLRVLGDLRQDDRPALGGSPE